MKHAWSAVTLSILLFLAVLTLPGVSHATGESQLLATQVSGTVSLNSLGEAVWTQYDQGTGTDQIFSSQRGQVSYDPASHLSPSANSLGDTVWVEYSNTAYWTYTLRGIIGGRQVTLANSQNWIGDTDINDRGEVVWIEVDGSNANQLHSNLRGQLTSGNLNRRNPSINNAGDIVFLQLDPAQPMPEQVYKVSAGSTTAVPFTSEAAEHRAVAINDAGEVVWVTRDGFSDPNGQVQLVSSVRGVLQVALQGDVYGVDLNNCGNMIYTTFDNGQRNLYRVGPGTACVSYPAAKDTQLLAVSVSFGDIFTGAFGSGPALHWYKFDAAAGDTVRIRTNYDNSQANLVLLRLYDGEGNLVAEPTQDPHSISAAAPYSGTYYLQLYGEGNVQTLGEGTFGYSVSLSKYSQNCGSGPCPDLVATDVWGGSLNSLGEAVWSRFDQGSGYNQIYSSTRGQLTFDQTHHFSPASNNLGDMVWVEFSTGSYWSYTLRGTIGGKPVVPANSQSWIGDLDINDRGEVVWMEQDSSNVNQLHSSLRGQLTSGTQYRYKASINNAGDIVFGQFDPAQGTPGQVYRIAADSTTAVAVTGDAAEHRSPAINDSGEIVWAARDMSTGVARIVSSVRGALPLTVGGDISSLDFNNCGALLYSTFEYGQQNLYRYGSGAACVTHPAANEVLADASAVSFGDIFTGAIDGAANAVDWYRFEAAAGDSIRVTVNYDSRPPNTLSVGIYDGQQGGLGSSSGPAPLSLVVTAPYSGVYYLKAEGAGRFGYAVSLGKYSQNCGSGVCPDLIATDVWSASANSLGEAVWSGFDQASGYNQIYSSTRGQLSFDQTQHFSPAINNLGDMVWVEYSTGSYLSYTLRGNIGGQPVTLANSQNWLGDPDVNDRGEVVWMEQDSSNFNQLHSSMRGQLTTGSQYRYKPSINNAGDIVFGQFDPAQGVPGQVYKISADGSTAVAVTNDPSEHRGPAINDSGEVVWASRDMSSGVSHIVSSVRGVLPVSVAGDIFSVDLNNCGVIFYNAFENGQQKLYRLGSSAACVTHPGANEVQGDAGAVSFGDIFTGAIDGAVNPVDWFRFDATAGDTIRVTVNYDNRAPNTLSLGLYDGQGTLISGPSGTGPLSIVVTAPYSGAYYLKAEGAGRFGYAVSLGKYSKNCGSGVCPDLIATDVWSASANSLGEAVWSGFDQASGYNQLYSSTRGQLSFDQTQHFSPAVNNVGDMVWVEYSTGSYWSYTLRGTIGGRPVALANSQNWLGDPDINDRGEVVWMEQDGSNFNQLHSNLRGQLTTGTQYRYRPSINNAGDIVFGQFDPAQGVPGQVYKISGGGSTAVAVTEDPTSEHRGPAINDSGEIVWAARDMSTGVSRIVSSVRGTLPLSVAGDIFAVDLTNCGGVFYTVFENGQQKLYRLGSGAACVSHPGANEVQGDAGAVSFGDIFTGAIDGGINTVDWYRFEATAGDTIRVTANYNATPPTMFFLALYDANGSLVPLNPGSTALSIVTSAPYSGSYYLKAEGYGRFGYAVSLSKYSVNCGAGPCPDLIAEGAPDGSLNSVGETVWTQYDQASGVQQIFSSTRGQLTFDLANHYSPAVNDLGDLVWVEYNNGYPYGYSVRGVINGQQVTLATSTDWLGDTDINNLGEVVWTQRDSSYNYQIQSSVRGQLTSGPINREQPSIDNLGNVVFVQYDPPLPGQIYLLPAGSTTPVPLTADPVDHRSPAISDSGEIVWGERGATPESLSSLFSTVRGRLPASGAHDIFGIDLNNCGAILYTAFANGPAQLYRLGSGAACSSVPQRQLALAAGRAPYGGGSGEIVSFPAGISVGAGEGMKVAAFPAGSEVTLNATADANSLFVGWTGACGGSGPCTVTMDLAKSVLAVFEAKPADTTPPAVTITAPAQGIISSNRPMLAFEVSDGTTVVKVDGTVVDKISGSILDPLSDGAHLVTVEATDAAGNRGLAEVHFTVDTTAPSVGIDPVVTPTKVAQLTISGYREAGAALGVAAGNAAVPGAITYPSATTWSCSVSGLTEGDTVVTVTATDAAGNSASAATTVTVDTTAPVVSIAAPGAGLTSSRTPLLVFSASEGTAVVTLDGIAVAKASGDTLGPLADGVHTVKVESTDAAGNLSSAEVSFTVDATVPTVTITSPTAGLGSGRTPSLSFTVSEGTAVVMVDGVAVSLTSGDVLGPFADGAHTVRVEAADAAGNAGFAEVTFSIDATAPEVSITSPAAGFTRTNTPILLFAASDGTVVVKVDGTAVDKHSGDQLSQMADGLHVARVEATDAAGNTAFAEASFTVDTTAPTVAISAPAAGATSSSTPVLTYSVSDGAVVVKVDGVVVNKVSGDALETLADGVHTLVVESTDAAGNVGTRNVSFTIDTTAPVVAIGAPAAGITKNNRPVISCSANDGTVVVKVDGVTVSKVSGDALDALADGPHTFVVESTDAAGNVGTAEVTFTVDTTAPVVVISAPAAGLTRDNRPVINYSLHDGTVVVKVDGVVVNKASGDALDALADGMHTLRVESTDAAGNVGTAEVTFTVDTAAPVVAISAPAAGITKNNRPVIDYSMNDGTAVVKVDGVIANKASGDALDALADGMHTLRVESTDAAGNVGTAEVTFTVDTAAPVVAISAPAAGLAKNNRPVIGYSANDGTVVVKVDGVVVNKLSGDALDVLADGMHTLRVASTDAAGNVGTAEVTFTVDTIAPMLGINPAVSPTNSTSQTIVGTREIDAAITVSVDSSASLGSVSYPTATTWNCAITGLAEGSNTITVTAMDAAGNSASSAATILADTVVPVVTIDAPTATLTNSRTPQLTFTASEGTPVVSVDGVVLAKVSGDTLGPLSDGSHTVRIESADAAGNSGVAEVTFTVDATAPTVTITSPTAGLGNNPSPVLGYSVSDGTAIVKVDGVVVSLQSGDTVGQLADGPHAVEVETTDAAGNVAYAAVNFTVDATAPGVTLTSPAAGLTTNNRPQLNFSTSDGAAVVKVDGVIVEKVSGDVLDVLADGLHVVRVEARDAAANTAFAEASFTVDTVAPSVSITSPAAALGNNNNPVLAYSVSDGTVVVKLDGVAVNVVSGDSLGVLADGAHTVWVEATDAAGNAAFAEATFTIDTASPVVSIASPATGTTVDRTPLLVFSATDGSVVVKVDGVVVNTASGASLGPLANGSHTVGLEATDAAGNVGVASVTFTVSYTPVTVATSSLPFGTTGAAYTQSLTVTGGVPGYTWSIGSGALPQGLSLNASTGTLGGTPTATGTFSFTVVAADSDGESVSTSLSIAVYAPLQVVTTSAAAGYAGETYSQSLAANGGLGPYAWSVGSGALPTGLSLNGTTGTISGTPTAAGTASFTVRAVDTNGTVASKALTISVNPSRPDLVVTTVSGPTSGTRSKRINVSATVKNQGYGSAAASTLTFYLSSDSTVTTGDIKLADAAVSTLTAGASQTVSLSVTVPSTMSVGTYYIGAIADRASVVVEADEVNNAKAGNVIDVR